MLPYKIHQFDGEEFDLSKTIPAYTKYCGYDYCIQEYNSQTFPIPVQNIFQFSKPAYLKDGYYRLYSKEFDLERSRNYKYFKNGEVYIQDSYSYRFEWGLSEYTRGFLEGYNESFIPFIDTPQTRIEMIVKAAIVLPEFVNIQTDNSRVVKMYCVYSQGLKEGRRYKAWGIIEKSPNAFVDYFKKPSSHQSMILQENSEATNSAADALKKKINQMLDDKRESSIRTEGVCNLKSESTLNHQTTTEHEEPLENEKIKHTVKDVYDFWVERGNNNIFKGYSFEQFQDKTNTMTLHNLICTKGKKTKIDYTIYILLDIMPEDWRDGYLKKIDTTKRNLGKNTGTKDAKAMKNHFK